MKRIGRGKIGIICLSLLFSMSLSFGVAGVCLMQGSTEAIAETISEEPSFSEIDLQDKEYAKGTQLPVPTVKMTLNGQQYVALSVLHYPDGTAQYVNGIVTLSSVGKYTIEYKATVNGTTYNKEETFSVYQPKFELTYGEGKAEYSTENVSGLEGELVSLEEGQTLTICDYFDITKATASEPIFEACIIPDQKGTADFQTLTVRFVSKNDPSRYLEIVGNHYDYNNCTYYLAGANTQTVTGYESSQGTIHVGNTWGAPISGSFRFTPNNNMSIKDDTMKIYLDYETKTVYANTGKVFVVDLDDPKYFGTLWEGFEDGEVYIEVSASRYQSSKPAQFLVMKAGDIDLKQQNVYDTEEPEIAIDFEGYSQNDLPSGVKGRAYPIFHASAKDYLCGDCDVNVRVWARYYTSQKYEVEVNGGAFIPANAGTYVIEYSAVDKTGNRSVKLINIKVIEDTEEINISLTDKQTSGKTGEYISLARIAANGGCGNLFIDVQVLFNGEAIDIGENGFLPRIAGNYTVNVTATDYIGREKSESYSVSVVANDSPVFSDKIELPKYLIEGSEYTFGEVFAYDYTSGSGEKAVKATLCSEDANGVKEHPDGKYTPSVANHLDTVKIYYKATVNGKTAQSQTFEIKTCVVGDGKNIDIGKYFVSDDVSVEATNNGMILSTKKDKSSVDFANPILANGLTYTFDVEPTQNSFSKFNVYLRDFANEKECIKISYIKASQTSSYISVNDGAKYSIPASFFGGSSHVFSIKFDNKTCVASYETEVRINVNKTVFGETFDGFSGGKVYVTFEFDGVGSGGAVILNELGGQQTTNVKADLIKPKIDLTDEIAGKYDLGDMIDLTTAVALDVLDPNISSVYTVYAPDGSVARDINGKVLENISVNESYRLKLTDYGIYRVAFEAVDWNGKKEKTFSYVLEVVDAVPPVIILNGEVPGEAKVGEVIHIPLARALDLIDGAREVYAFILRPDGRYQAYESGMVFEMSGKYSVVYYAFDESGNTTKLVYTINVK